MRLLFDFFPIVLFFITYRCFGIYAATGVAMAASLTQVIAYRLKHQCYEKMHLASCVMIVVLGTATLIFHNPWFIKFKPTVVYWMMALAILVSQWYGNKTLVQRMMEKNIDLSSAIWLRLNQAWASYFFILGMVNVAVAYYFSTDVWVYFKLFGGVGLTFLFVVLQAVYLARHVQPEASIQS